MPVTIQLQPDHALVLAAALGLSITNLVLGSMVVGARNKYKIPLPALYATPGMMLKDGKIDPKEVESRVDAFNRVQRGHQHYCAENLADAYAMLLINGVFYPRYSAFAGFAYALGSLVYAVGYKSKPEGRFLGEAIYFPAVIAWYWGIGSTAWALWNQAA